MMVDIREYHDRGGRSPFREWFDRLNAEAARKVTAALYRVGLGNFSNAKSKRALERWEDHKQRKKQQKEKEGE